MTAHHPAASPMVVQVDGRRIRSAPLPLQKRLHIERRVPFQQVVHGTSPLRGSNGAGVALAGFLLQAREVFLAHRVGPQAQDSRFGEGPLEIGVADLRAGGPVPLACGCLRPLDQAAVGHTIWHAGEALEVMDFVEQYPAQDRTDSRDGPQQVKRVSIRLLRCLADGQCHVAEQRIVVVKQCQIDCNARPDRRLREPLGDTIAVRFVGDLLPNRGQILLAVGILKVGQQRGPFTHQRHPSPEQITRGPHRRGIDLRLREHPTAEQDSNLVGVDRIMFGFAAMDRLHRERVSEDERNLCPCPEVGQPIPGKETFDTDDHILPVGGNGLEKRCWASGHVPVDKNLTILVQDAEIHGAGMPLEAAVKWMLFRVEAPEVSSLCE